MEELPACIEEIKFGRIRLPSRRASETFEIECHGLNYKVTVSRLAKGNLGEIFLTAGKAGSAADIAARDAAIACSIALQYGADIETIRKALCRDGIGRPNAPWATVLDLIAGEGAP
jgi:ribonucleoside-diphosphate reductase alpha chain